MKTVLVLLAVMLVICEGYNPEYRNSKNRRNRYEVEESYEDDYVEMSVEEAEEDSTPRIERKMRASVNEPSYGYSKYHKRRDNREYEVKTRKPSYSEKKTRGKYPSYETNSHKSFKKDIVAKQRSTVPDVRSRKKDHRSAPVYESTYSYPSPPAPYSTPPVVPHLRPVSASTKLRCAHRLLISCTPTVTRVPCGAYSGKPYPTPSQYVPVAHVPTHQVSPSAPVPQAPTTAYQGQPSFQVLPPAYAAPAFTPPAYNAPVYSPPSTQYIPQSKPLYHHQAVQTQPEPVQQPSYHNLGQHPYYQQPKPTPHWAAPPAYHQPYQPSHRSMEPTPSFAAPVSEDRQEVPHHSIISAFPTTTTQQVPTVSPNREQTTQKEEIHVQRPAPDADDTKTQREASGDEPEEEKRVTTQPTSTTSMATTTATSSPLQSAEESEK